MHGHGELENEEARIVDEYLEGRYKPCAYQKVFALREKDGMEFQPSYRDSYFECAKFLLEEIVARRLSGDTHGVTAVFLCRHSAELSLKYTLFHCRWLKNETENSLDSEIADVKKVHPLQEAWNTLMTELRRKAPSILAEGLDLKFVQDFVEELHTVDPRGWRFRYPSERIGIPQPSEASKTDITTDYKLLLFSFVRSHNILDALDTFLVEQHGQNEDWEHELNSW